MRSYSGGREGLPPLSCIPNIPPDKSDFQLSQMLPLVLLVVIFTNVTLNGYRIHKFLESVKRFIVCLKMPYTIVVKCCEHLLICLITFQLNVTL